jgi:hypothetical protein
MVTKIASEVVGYEERKKRDDWYDEECQTTGEKRKKARIKMLKRRM